MINDLLASYPRTRPSLGQRHRELYVAEYKRGRSGGAGLPGTVAKVEAWMHKAVASAEEGTRILELGAGTLNHLCYENKPAIYDVVEPFRELWEGSPRLDKITSIYSDISEIPDQKYDRIISVAVLEHLTNLPDVVARCGLMLHANGRFSAGIPSEGGFLWSLGWRATTGLSFRLRTGLSYEPYMRHEHINFADEIVAVTRYFFEDLRIRRFPFASKHLSLYTVLDASKPRLSLCREFIQRSRV